MPNTMCEIRDTKYEIRNTSYEKGFTLVELLVALIVSSIILAAVATLAFAISSANVSTDDISSKQAKVRFATLKISELIRHCKLIYSTSGSDITIWKEDSDGDNTIDSDEMVYIEAGEDANYIQIHEPDTNPVVLIPKCKNVLFGLYDSNFEDSRASPLKTKYVSITFGLVENGVEHQYQVNNDLRSWAGNLLSADGQSIVSDDD
jgi:prepilin-type N-terminal cleavage/methylation domain-containing protein